jgi:hypothetical protein
LDVNLGLNLNLHVVTSSRLTEFWRNVCTQAVCYSKLCFILAMYKWAVYKRHVFLSACPRDFSVFQGVPSTNEDLFCPRFVLINHFHIYGIWHWTMGLWLQVQYRSHTEMSVKNIKSNCWRSTVCNQWYDSQRLRNSICTRSHPRKKYQATYKLRITLQPINSAPSTTCTTTKKTVASWPVIRSTRSPRWKGLHHASNSTS